MPGTGHHPWGGGTKHGSSHQEMKVNIFLSPGKIQNCPFPSACPQRRGRRTSTAAFRKRQGKAEAPSSSSAWRWLMVIQTQPLCTQEHVYLPLQNWTPAGTTASKCSSWRGHSTTSFSAISISISIKLSEVTQLQPRTTKIHGRSMYRKPVH